VFTLFFEKPRFKFSASHFTIFSKDQAEALHGHNYQVQIQIAFKEIQKDTELAVDFNVVKKEIKILCDSLDEKVLIPTTSPFLEIKKSEDSLSVTHSQWTYSFPKKSVVLLPLSNITSESLCRYFSLNIADKTKAWPTHPLFIEARVDETLGQGSSYKHSL